MASKLFTTFLTAFKIVKADGHWKFKFSCFTQLKAKSSDCLRHQVNLIQLQPSEYRSQSDHLWSIILLSDTWHTTSQYAKLHLAILLYVALLCTTLHCFSQHCTSRTGKVLVFICSVMHSALWVQFSLWYIYKPCLFVGQNLNLGSLSRHRQSNKMTETYAMMICTHSCTTPHRGNQCMPAIITAGQCHRPRVRRYKKMLSGLHFYFV